MEKKKKVFSYLLRLSFGSETYKCILLLFQSGQLLSAPPVAESEVVQCD